MPIVQRQVAAHARGLLDLVMSNRCTRQKHSAQHAPVQNRVSALNSSIVPEGAATRARPRKSRAIPSRKAFVSIIFHGNTARHAGGRCARLGFRFRCRRIRVWQKGTSGLYDGIVAQRSVRCIVKWGTKLERTPGISLARPHQACDQEDHRKARPLRMNHRRGLVSARAAFSRHTSLTLTRPAPTLVPPNLPLLNQAERQLAEVGVKSY